MGGRCLLESNKQGLRKESEVVEEGKQDETCYYTRRIQVMTRKIYASLSYPPNSLLKTPLAERANEQKKKTEDIPPLPQRTTASR
jgi:hypothetical protein